MSRLFLVCYCDSNDFWRDAGYNGKLPTQFPCVKDSGEIGKAPKNAHIGTDMFPALNFGIFFITQNIR